MVGRPPSKNCVVSLVAAGWRKRLNCDARGLIVRRKLGAASRQGATACARRPTSLYCVIIYYSACGAALIGPGPQARRVRSTCGAHGRVDKRTHSLPECRVWLLAVARGHAAHRGRFPVRARYAHPHVCRVLISLSLQMQS
jgi:hypothetical protein